MFSKICPKLPMRNKAKTFDYYVNKLGFENFGNEDFEDYLMLKKDEIEIHFFLFKDLNPLENYGQVYIRIYRPNLSDFFRSKHSHSSQRKFTDQTLGTKRIFTSRSRQKSINLRTNFSILNTKYPLYCVTFPFK